MDSTAANIFLAGGILLVVGNVLGWLISVAALVFGVMGLRGIAKNPRPNQGLKMAMCVVALLFGVPTFGSTSLIIFYAGQTLAGQTGKTTSSDVGAR